jgi:hypothetical protein
MNFEQWCETPEAWQAAAKSPLDFARAAWNAAVEIERERCDEIRDSEARDMDR